MSTLVVLLPPRARLGPATESPAEGEAMPAEYSYAYSPDGLTLTKQGEAAPDVLPKADSVVAVVGDLDLSWHPITCPKAPAARMRAALAGVLEEQLLDDESHLALALAPQAAAGKPGWVAALHKAWLSAHLARLEKAGLFVERVVPASWPDEAAQGHFLSAGVAADGSSANTWLVRSDAQGVHPVRLNGSLAPAAIQRWQLEPTRWTAQPAVAAQAERWLGAPVLVQTDAERGLQAVRSLWNLRQFDLAPRHRGVRALRDLFKQWRGPAWKPVRWGLAALLLLQLAGLNLWAWHEKRAVDNRRQAQVALLKAAHPQVRAVLDAPLQMRRETDQLRAAAGRPGEADLEALLAAAALAWPDGRPPVENLRFEPGRLTLAASNMAPPQVEAIRSRLRPAGWAVEAAEGRLTITRASASGASPESPAAAAGGKS